MRDKSKKLTVVNTDKRKPAPSGESTTQVVGGGSFGGISIGGGLDYLLKAIWDKVWEIKTDSQGNEYIFGKLPLVTQYGITMYADGGELDLPSIYAGLPIDGNTLIRDDNGVLMINPDIDLGGGLTEVYWNDIKLKPTFATVATSGKYADLSGLPDLSVYATTEYLIAELKKYVTLNTEQTIAAHKNFLNGLSVGGLGITKSQDDVIYLDANLVVRGGITMYAEGEVDIPSILDSLPIASTTAKGIASFDSSYFSVDSNGKVTLLAENVGLNETELFEYLSRNNYAKKSDIPSLSGYATETYVEDRLDDLINGAPAAYDTLKEIADVLAGNVDSIGDIITTLGTKADKAIKISAGTGLSGGGTLEADRTLSLATSGVTAGTYRSVTVDKYGRVTNGTNPTTLADYGITDAYTKDAVDTLLGNYVTLKTTQTITGEKNFTGGLKVNGSPIVYDATNKYWKLEGDLLVTGGVTMFASDSAFTPSTIMAAIATDGTNLKVVNGVLTFVGSIDGGEAGSVAWENVMGKPSWIGPTKPSYSYKEISGTPTLLSSFINDQGFASTLGELTNVGSWADSAPTQGRLLYQAAGSSVWSYKNVSEFVSESGSYLPLTGGTLSGSVFSPAFCLTSRGSGTYNVSSIQYDSEYGLYFEAAKESDSYAAVNTSMYFGWRGGKKAMVIRGNGNIGIGFIDPLHKLEVNGDAYFNGCISLHNGRLIDSLSTSGTLYNILEFNELNTVVLGWSTSFASCPTFLCGHYIDFYTGGIVDVKMRLSRDGNLGIGFLAPSHKLEVNGDAYFSGFAQTGGYVRTGSGVAFYNIGTGTYNIATLTVDNNYGMFFDAARASDNGSALKLPFGWFWRGDNSPSMTLSSGGNLLVSGGITMYSDIRKKTKLQDVELSLKQIADAPLIEHYYNSDSNKTTHVGSIAQYWAGINDWFCKLDSEGFYTMEIQNAALASAISIARELVKYESKTDKEIRLLKNEVKRLKKEIKILKSA